MNVTVRQSLKKSTLSLVWKPDGAIKAIGGKPWGSWLATVDIFEKNV